MKQSTQHKSQRRLNIVGQSFGALALSVLLNGCLSPPQQTQSTAASSVPPSADVPRVATPSPLSYGAITSTVKKGTTTQGDLVRLFGGPNIATLDADGTETWVYEKTASETSTTSQQTVTAQAQRLDIYFGLGLLRQETGAAQSNAGATVTHSIKTLTVIIKFNQDKTVKDFSARASYF